MLYVWDHDAPKGAAIHLDAASSYLHRTFKAAHPNCVQNWSHQQYAAARAVPASANRSRSSFLEEGVSSLTNEAAQLITTVTAVHLSLSVQMQASG